jgi:hypothetical protein
VKLRSKPWRLTRQVDPQSQQNTSFMMINLAI